MPPHPQGMGKWKMEVWRLSLWFSNQDNNTALWKEEWKSSQTCKKHPSFQAICAKYYWNTFTFHCLPKITEVELLCWNSEKLQTRRLIIPKNLARPFLTALEDFHIIWLLDNISFEFLNQKFSVCDCLIFSHLLKLT